MGATTFIATDEEKDWAANHASTLGIIISAVSSPKMPIQEYLNLLRLNGQFVQVGAPEDIVPGFSMFALILKRCNIGGSLVGSRQDTKDMLNLFAEKGVKAWTNNVPMEDANKAVVNMAAGKPRYRYVLVNEKHCR